MDKKILILTGDNLGLKNEQIDYPDVAVVKFPVVIDEKEYFEDETHTCLLYTSDAADDLLCVDLGGTRIIKKKTKPQQPPCTMTNYQLIPRT